VSVFAKRPEVSESGSKDRSCVENARLDRDVDAVARAGPVAGETLMRLGALGAPASPLGICRGGHPASDESCGKHARRLCVASRGYSR